MASPQALPALHTRRNSSHVSAPDNRRDFPGGFAGDQRNAFTVQGRTPEEQEIFAHMQTTLHFRRDHAALRRGKLVHIGWAKNYYAFLRDDGHERLLVVFNNASEQQLLALPLAATPLATATTVRPILNAATAEIENGNLHCSIAANSVAIFGIE